MKDYIEFIVEDYAEMPAKEVALVKLDASVIKDSPTWLVVTEDLLKTGFENFCKGRCGVRTTGHYDDPESENDDIGF